MVHHICLLKLKHGVSPEQVETLMVETRIRLLKIPEVINLRVGKKIDTKGNPHDIFFSMDCENLNKLKIVQESAIYVQFKHKILDHHVDAITVLDYEMEPGKDVTYS